MPSVNVQSFLDKATETWTYVVFDKASGAACVIDPVLDFDYASGKTANVGLDAVIAFIKQQQLQLHWIFETHAHADHLTAAYYLRQQLGGKIATGNQVTVLQKNFAAFYNLKDLATDGSQFDALFADGMHFFIGELEAKIIATPGHTPACVSLIIGDCVFIGDTLFAPDLGTARCDFPGGDAKRLYQSIETLLSLPENTKLYLCHDYPAGKRDYQCVHTVKEHKQNNIHIAGKTEAQFVALRQARDQTLAMPRLILPSIQVNIRAGQLPQAEDNGVSYLKVPLNTL